MVKNKAISLSKCRDFIASKGWLDKFKVRYKLDIAKEQKGRISSQMKQERLKWQQEAVSNNYGSSQDDFSASSTDSFSSYDDEESGEDEDEDCILSSDDYIW